MLYRDSLDDAISMLRVREAYRLTTEKKSSRKKKSCCAPPMESTSCRKQTPLSTQLVKFQRNKKKVGLVVDEYGDIQGLVTVEDILKGLLAILRRQCRLPAEEVTPLNDGSVIIDDTPMYVKSTRLLTGICRKMKREPLTVLSST